MTFRQPISQDLECSATSEWYLIVKVLSSDLHMEVTGYQAIIQFNDPNNNENLLVNESDFSCPVLMPGLIVDSNLSFSQITVVASSTNLGIAWIVHFMDVRLILH